MRQGKAKYVFPGSNTPLGFFSFYEQGLSGMDQVFILKGGPGTGKSTLIRKIGSAMLDRGYDVEFWQCSSDNDSLDGALIPAISVAIIDGTAPHTVDPKYPGAVDEIINLGDHWDEQYLRHHKPEIVSYTHRIKNDFTKCYDALFKAGELRKDIETLQSRRLDLNKAENAALRLGDEIFKKQEHKTRHLFSSAITPAGLVSYMDSLSQGYSIRYILKGAPGSGQDIFMASVFKTAQKGGHSIEVYHSTYNPKDIELLLLPELDVAIAADSGETPLKPLPQDRIIELKDFLTPDEAADLEGENLAASIIELTGKAAEYINRAKENHDDLETFYTKAMDFEAVDFTASRVFNRILGIAAAKEK